MVDIFLEATFNFFAYPRQQSLNNLNFRSIQGTCLVITIDVQVVVLMTKLHSVSLKQEI